MTTVVMRDEKAIANRTLVSLAMLKVLWDRKKHSFLDTFVPMVVECIYAEHDDVISAPAIQNAMIRQFGLSIPVNVVKSILNRAKREGYIRNEKGVYRKAEAQTAYPGFRTAQSEMALAYDRIIDKLRNFAKSEHGIDWVIEAADQALFDYLGRFGFSSQTSLLGRFEFATPGVRNNVHRIDNVVATFIKGLIDQDEQSFLEMLLQGDMLRNAVYFADTNQIDRKFKNTEIYFDTSFLIFALGYAGKTRQAPCSELIQLLWSSGATLRCFQHTYDEICGAFTALEGRAGSGTLRTAWGPSAEYFVEQNLTASDIALLRTKLPDDLRKLKIEVVDTPDYNKDEYKHVIDEEKLIEILEERLHYKSEIAARRDMRSISAVTQLRRGRITSHFEDCRGLFVTSNNALCSICNQFIRQEAKSTSDAVPICVTDHMLTAILWVKQPLKSPNLPRKS